MVSLACPDRAVPAALHWLFWEIEPTTVDLVEHADYVMERVMSRGNWAAMCWLRRVYGEAELAAFLRHRGERLAPRERAYWELVAGVAPSSDAQAPGGGRPPWAGA